MFCNTAGLIEGGSGKAPGCPVRQLLLPARVAWIRDERWGCAKERWTLGGSLDINASIDGLPLATIDADESEGSVTSGYAVDGSKDL